MIQQKNVFLAAIVSTLMYLSGWAQTPNVTYTVGYPVGTLSGRQVCYGNSKYLLLTGYNSSTSLNTIYGSPDGSSWNKVSTAALTSTPLNGLAFGAGIFVAVGNDGIIQSSTDGTTWTNRTSGTTSNLLRVVFLNNKFFALGRNRTLLTSTDGIAWTPVSISVGTATDYFNSLTYGNGVFILSGRNDVSGTVAGAVVYRSATAENNSWTYTNTAFALGTTLNRIQFLNNKFFAFTSGNTMYNSTDGNTWTNFTSSVVLSNPDNTTIPWGTGHQIFNGVWDGTKYFFYGSSQYYGGYGSTFVSTNGTDLTLIEKSAYIVPQESVILNGIYFVCGNEGIVSSADGLTYKHPGFGFRDVVKTAGKYVTIGNIGQQGQVANSTDFDEWVERTPASVKEMNAIAYDGTNVLAGGTRYIIRSANEGNTWTTVYENSNETILALAYGNGRFVAGGTNNSNVSFMRYSANGGETWTNAANDDIYYHKIKFVNNRFFAFGYDNNTYESRILTSADGIAWTDGTPVTSYEVLYFKDVVFDGAKYHVMGIESSNWEPVGFFTLSSATPEAGNSYGNKATISNVPAGVVLGGTWDEGVLEYTNGVFTAAVIDVNTGQDYILSSATGNSWTAYPQNSYGSILASVVDGSNLYMVGRANALYKVNYGTPLPVSLMHFKGSMQQASALLTWATSAEKNSSHFELQHSIDGNTWHTIGKVAAAVQSNQTKQYSFLHSNPVKNKNLYRLMLHDRDGKITQSSIAVVMNGSAGSITIYPNPASNRMVVRSGSNTAGNIYLYNTAGQIVKSAKLTGYETAIDIQGMPAGIYHAVIEQGNQSRKQTVIIR